jgi:hypothetical protein
MIRRRSRQLVVPERLELTTVCLFQETERQPMRGDIVTKWQARPTG